MSNLLAQNKELKRLKKEAERRKVEDDELRDIDDAESRARDVEDFEKVQAGLNGQSEGMMIGRNVGGRQHTTETDATGRKRKFGLNEDEPEENDQTKRRASESKKPKSELPSFWVPGETPENHKADVKALKQTPTCPAANLDKPHEFSLKTLVTVHFHADEPPTTAATTTASHPDDTPKHICPSCNKTLTNSSKAILAKPCGHVLCKACSDRFQRPLEKSAHDDNRDHDGTVRCYVCQTNVTPGRKVKRKKDGEGEKESKAERGLVELSSEGTGFAGGGKSMVKKEGVAFQC